MDLHMGREMNHPTAAIDIGSNTVLLLVGTVTDKRVTVLHEEQCAPRLGQGVDAEQNLHPKSIKRVIEILKTYQSVLDEEFPEVQNAVVTATSAVRDAANKRDFTDRVLQETGLNVRILSGADEADFTYAGAHSVISEREGVTAVIDIGGGSTEVAIGKNHIMHDRHSFDVGSVRYTERFLKTDPPSVQEIKRCRKAIRDALRERSFNWKRDTSLIGVAGTVTSLASIAYKIDTYQPEKLNNKVLTLEQISAQVKNFMGKKSGQLLENNSEILKGRADVILAGMLILEEFMKLYHITELTVSTGGIRHGGLMRVH
jgi:exopolyphosphatase/guanosine-5'-triphosphate,3'-diphosphate pyrophosphatase